MNYAKTLSKAVGRKWPTPEEKEWWWTKFTVARRRRTARLSEAQNHRCAFCGVKTFLNDSDFQPGMNRKRHLATLEHITPQTEGGTDHMSNCVMACHDCNNIRGTIDAFEFYEIRNDPNKWFKFLKDRTRKADKRAKKSIDKPLSPEQEAMAFRLALYCVMFPGFQTLFDRGLADVQHVMKTMKPVYEKHERNFKARQEVIQQAREALEKQK